MLSPRLATYKALPGGATVTRDGSGAFGTSGVADRDVRSNLGFAVCAEAPETPRAIKLKVRKKQVVASDFGPV